MQCETENCITVLLEGNKKIREDEFGCVHCTLMHIKTDTVLFGGLQKCIRIQTAARINKNTKDGLK